MAAASGLAQKFRIVLQPKFKIKNSKSSKLYVVRLSITYIKFQEAFLWYQVQKIFSISCSIEEVAEAAPKALKWFQLYIYKDRQVFLYMNGFERIDKIQNSNCR